MMSDAIASNALRNGVEPNSNGSNAVTLSLPISPDPVSQSLAKATAVNASAPNDMSSPKKAPEANVVTHIPQSSLLPTALSPSKNEISALNNRTTSASNVQVLKPHAPAVPVTALALPQNSVQDPAAATAVKTTTTTSDDKVCKVTSQASDEKKKEKIPESPRRKKPSENKKKSKSRELSAIQKDKVVSAADHVPESKSNRIVKEAGSRNRKRKEVEAIEAEPEQRTGKRVRLQHLPFQHPAAQQIHSQYYRNPFSSQKSSTSKDSNSEDKIVVFNRGDFLAVRNDSDSFYICRTTQNVYKTSRKFKIQWLQNEKSKDVYQLDFMDQTDFECVLTNLRMNRKTKGTYELPSEEKQRVLNILQRAINVERGVTDVPDLKQVAADGIDVSIVGKKEEKEFLKLEATAKKEIPAPSAPAAAKVKHPKASEVSAKNGTSKKASTESTRSSSRKSDAKSRQEEVKNSGTNKVESKKETKKEKLKKKSKKVPVKAIEKADRSAAKLSEKRSSTCSSSESAKSKILVKKIVEEIKKKHNIEKTNGKESKPKAEKEEVKAGKVAESRTSRLSRSNDRPAVVTAAAPTAAAAAAPVILKPPQHHETIRGLVNLLNTYSSDKLRFSALKLLEQLAADYPKDCLPFIVETLLTAHKAFQENDDNFIAGPHFPRRVGKESPPKSRIPKSLFQMYFNQKMMSIRIGVDKDYDRAVAGYYASYYEFVISICKIGIKSDFVSGDLVSLCSTVALESLPTGTPVFVCFWKELVEEEEKGQENQFFEVLSHCPNFRNYIIALLNQERKFLVHDVNFDVVQSLAPKVKTMSTLTQKLVSNRSSTLIDDISKDYHSFESIKDLNTFLMVLRALNLSLLYESKSIESEKLETLLQNLKDQFEKSSCNGDVLSEGKGNTELTSKENGITKMKSCVSNDKTNKEKIKLCISSILKLLAVPK